MGWIFGRGFDSRQVHEKEKRFSACRRIFFHIIFLYYYYPKKQTARLVDRGVKHEKKSNLSNIRKKL